MGAVSPPGGRVRVLHALRHRDFRLLFAGQTVSLLGDAAFFLALGWRTFTLAGSGKLGIVLALEGVGMLGTLLIGGVLADRYRRRTLMIASDLSRAAVVGALAALDASSHLSFGLLCACALGVGLGTGFFQPAFGGIVPLVVDQPSLPSANALIGISRQVSFMVGPAVAGAIYGAAGSATMFSFNAASFLVSAGLLWFARPRSFEPEVGEGTVREIAAGIRYVAGIPWLWVTIALFSIFLMSVLAPMQVLMPKLIQQHFERGVAAYGLLMAFVSAGMIVGSVIFGQTNPRRRRATISYAIWVTNSLIVAALVLSPWYPLALGLAVSRGVLVGFGIAVWDTMLQELVPEQMLSRVVSLDYFGSLGLMPLGLLFAAGVAGFASPGAIIATGAAIAACLFAAGYVSSPRLRAID